MSEFDLDKYYAQRNQAVIEKLKELKEAAEAQARREYGMTNYQQSAFIRGVYSGLETALAVMGAKDEDNKGDEDG